MIEKQETEGGKGMERAKYLEGGRTVKVERVGKGKWKRAKTETEAKAEGVNERESKAKRERQ